MGFLNDLASVVTRWRTWALLAHQDIQLRYRRSVLGPFWISIALGTLVLGIGLLYSQIQNQPFKEYLTYFGCGMLAWTLLLSLITEGAGMVVEAEPQLRNLPLPMPLLAARVVHRNLIIFVHNALVIGTMMVVFGKPPTVTAFAAIPGILLYLPLGVFFCIAFGPICARFRDFPQIIASIMQVMFFLTPIFWIPGGALDRSVVVTANPFYHLVEIVRAPLLGEYASVESWIVSLVITAITGVLAVISLMTTRRQIFLWL